VGYREEEFGQNGPIFQPRLEFNKDPNGGPSPRAKDTFIKKNSKVKSGGAKRPIALGRAFSSDCMENLNFQGVV